MTAIMSTLQKARPIDMHRDNLQCDCAEACKVSQTCRWWSIAVVASSCIWCCSSRRAKAWRCCLLLRRHKPASRHAWVKLPSAIGLRPEEQAADTSATTAAAAAMLD